MVEKSVTKQIFHSKNVIYFPAMFHFIRNGRNMLEKFEEYLRKMLALLLAVYVFDQ